MNEPWRVALLGGLRAQQGDRVVTRFKTQKVAALFAYLAFHLRQAHPREFLIELLWPESDAPTLRNSLSVALSSLRHQFEPPGVPQGTVLRADRFSVSLNPATVTTDVAEFEQALKSAARAGSSLERVQHLTQAVELYQGPLLTGFYEDWVPVEQERLSGLFLDALDVLVGHYEGLGDLQAAIGHARRAVAVDPLREEGQQHLIRLLAAAGQPGAALRQYQAYERVVEEEYGGEASPSLRALARRIERETGLAAPPGAVSFPSPPPPPRGPGGPATVTFLLTDINTNQRGVHTAENTLSQARERYQRLLRPEFERHGGREIQATGDGFVVTFPTASGALACAVAAQQAVSTEGGPAPPEQLRVRLALHTGEVRSSEEALDAGLALRQAGRLLAAAQAGQILVSDATAALLPSERDDGVRLVDLGVYRLPEFAGARWIYQVEFPGMQADFDPPAAESGFRSNLPPRFNRFFGREQEMAVLRGLLESPEVRLLTLSGPGGAGKTRLALETADRLDRHFGGAIYFVPLADLRDPALIAGAVVDSLRVPRTAQGEPLDQAVQALNEKPTLLVLDNYEHLVDGGAQVVQALLQRVPSLTLLITSRQLLGLSTEREFVVAPLPTPEGDESTEALSLFDSVQLFLDRAQQVMPHFQVTNANAAAVAGLVGGLEGIPLAIELAAARVQVLTPAQMLVHLSHRFDFLATRKRDVAERQRTLRGALEWSYRLLVPELQRFFCRLSVFRGGWTVEAAATVCEEPLALDYLEQLRECSLVIPMDGPESDLRFRMLETLREYGQERLAERKEADCLRERHLTYFLAFAEEAEERLVGPEQKTVLDRLEFEHENLRAALDWSSSAAREAVSGLRLCGALARFWRVRGYFGEGRAWCGAALERAAGRHPGMPHSQPEPDGSDREPSPERKAELTKARARCLNGAATLAHLQGDQAQAHVQLEESLVIWRHLGDQAGIATSLNNLGTVARVQGAYPQARSFCEEALALNRALDARSRIADNLNNLALVAGAQADYARAREIHEESLLLRRELGDRAGAAASLNNLGLVAQAQGDYARARTLYEESLAIKRSLGDRSGIAGSLGNLAMVAQSLGDYARTRALHAESLTISREIGDPSRQAVSLGNLGLVARAEGDYEEARGLFEESLRIRRGLSDRRGIASSLSGLADVAAEQGDWVRARKCYEEAAALNRELGTRSLLADNLLALGVLASAHLEHTRARALCEESLSIQREIGNRHGIVRSLLGLGTSALSDGDQDSAHAHLSEALQLLPEVGDRLTGARTLEACAELARAQGKRERTALLLGAAEALREALGAPRSARKRADLESVVTDLRASLGAEAFATAWSAGRAMSWEIAMAYGLEKGTG